MNNWTPEELAFRCDRLSVRLELQSSVRLPRNWGLGGGSPGFVAFISGFGIGRFPFREVGQRFGLGEGDRGCIGLS
jgi:hypothetical protein